MIYRRITELCGKKGISIPQLAEKIGMSRSLYKTLKNKSLKVETLQKIADTLNVDIEEFLFEESDFKRDGTDLKLLISLYKELITRILDDNPSLKDKERITQLFDNYNKLINLDEYNWTRTKWR